MAFVPVVESMFRNHEDNHLPSSSSCVPQNFHGVSGQFLMRRSMSFSGLDDRADQELNPDDMSDDGGTSQMIGGKKRRLNLEQVKALEKSFELGNKLEPERKMQLARALGLQPRQIAIWFQNRRARWKTKQLEKDYDMLKRQFEALKSDNDALKSQNKKLQSQLLSMKIKESKFSGCSAINLNKENEGCWSNGSDDNSGGINLNNKNGVVFPSSITTTPPPITGSLTQVLLQNHPPASRPSSDHHHHHPTSNQLFCNMFGNIEENQELIWSWPEQHNNLQ